MNIAETLKHLGNHWELYCLAGDGEYSFDRAKKYLMDECEKPESTASSKIDYRGQEMEELEVLYDFQKEETSDWMDKYYQLKELSQKQEARAYKENLELRKDSAKTITGISEKVVALANDCDKRLQQLEQRDFMAKGQPFIERVKIFFQMKLGLIPIKEYRKMELEVFRVSDELKEIQKRFGGED